MGNVRFILVGFCLSMCLVEAAPAQVSIGIGLPNVSIGINLPVYPNLVRVPGYPVYYAPRVNANYFFYDGMYWVFLNDVWYASAWYNGPWHVVAPDVLPYYILRVPVRYYRQPPPYFRNWRESAPPRWHEKWGRDWQEKRSGWNQWNRKTAPAPAPLPRYQRRYPADNYPQLEKQRMLHNERYRYEPRSRIVREQYKIQRSESVKHGKHGR